jgi:hypothetical protein
MGRIGGAPAHPQYEETAPIAPRGCQNGDHPLDGVHIQTIDNLLGLAKKLP